LDSEAAIAAFLSDILEANDAALLASALGDIARARGMTEIAKSAGITREALYKALRPDSSPRFDTVNRVCAALGVRLVEQAVHTAG
jgi:probable addiction module antidote protein